MRPDLTVAIAPRLVDEIDGPMLRHGLQEIADARLLVPRERAAQPDRRRLEIRYEQFVAAS